MRYALLILALAYIVSACARPYGPCDYGVVIDGTLVGPEVEGCDAYNPDCADETAYALFMLAPRIGNRQVVATDVHGRPTVRAGTRGPEPLRYLSGMHYVVVTLDDGERLVYSISCPGGCQNAALWAESHASARPSN